jgi:hypothetical protein
LALAAGAGNDQHVKRLLEAWVTSNKKSGRFQEDNNDKTPLMVALFNKQWPCAKVLFDHLIENREYDRILDILLLLRSIGPVHQLDHGTRPETKDQISFIFQNILEPDGCIKEESTTLLHRAVHRSESDYHTTEPLAALYSLHQYSPDGVDADGRTALLLATQLSKLAA